MEDTVTAAGGAPRDPKAARIVGMAGLIPFVFCAVGLWVQNGTWSDDILFVQCVYGAVILSFLGGVRWGVSLMTVNGAEWSPWISSVLPSLVAWASVILGGIIGLFLLAAGFVAQLCFDMHAVQSGNLPYWFGKLRMVLSVGAVLSLVTSAFALI